MILKNLFLKVSAVSLMSMLMISCSHQNLLDNNERTPASPAYLRIACDNQQIKIKDSVLIIDSTTKFNLSPALQEVLITENESFTKRLKALSAVDLLDSQNNSLSVRVFGGWTGMRVSYDLMFFNSGTKAFIISGCAYAPWQSGSH